MQETSKTSINKILYIFVLVVVTAFAGYEFFMAKEAKERADNLSEEIKDLQTKIYAQEKLLEENKILLQGKQDTIDYLSKKQNGGSLPPATNNNHAKPSSPRVVSPSAPKNNAPKDSPSSREEKRHQMVKKQLSRVYKDLLEDLNLPEETKNKFVDHMAKSAKTEAEFNKKLMDPNVSVDELMRLQQEQKSNIDRELDSILSSSERRRVENYHADKFAKMQKTQLNMLVNSLGLSDGDKQVAQEAVTEALKEMSPPKKLGNLTREDIMETKEMFAGAKPGSKEFIQSMMERGKKELKPVLDGLKKSDLTPEGMDKVINNLEKPISNGFDKR